MVYQQVGYNEPCPGRRSIRREVNNTDKKGKEKASEEGSVGSHKSRRSEGEKEHEKADTRPAPVAESNNDEDDSDELPDIKL